MKKFKVGLMLSVVAALVGSVFGVSSVFAEQVDVSMAVSPPNHRIILIPGEKYHGSIDVSGANSNTRDVYFSVSIGSFSQQKNSEKNDDYGTVDYEAVSNYNQMMNWITLDQSSGVVKPNSSVTIQYTIDVPEDAPAGGQYASLIVRQEEGPVSESQGASIQNVLQILSIIYAEVAGDTREAGSIIENNIPAFLFDGSSFEATSMVENTGNVHTNAEYILQVWPLFSNEEICTNEEKPDTSLILPETKRYHAQSCSLPSIGVYKVKQIVKIFGEESVVERLVIVCPVWLLFIVAFGIMIGILYICARIKKRKND